MNKAEALHNFLNTFQDYITTPTAQKMAEELGVELDFNRIN